ncbi:MAG TPA: carboxypeptidase-like regulatory domain-containing protein [Terriglobales bacterium]|nr:carboxypeptidase-like regulatory domain-containing protein [Terriglobales bacterium]
MMKRIALLVFLAGWLAAVAGAQATSRISGTVSASGASVPGAEVTATNLNTNVSRSAETTADGTYTVPALPLGTYKLAVIKQGFKTFTQSGIVLQVNSNPTVNVSLQIGNMAQTVEVRADASMVQAQDTSVGEVIQPEQVVDLPLNGRQATDLIALSGAAVVGTSGGLVNTLDFPTAVSYSVAGSQQNATNYALDGAPNMDYRTNVGEPLPFPDALQEFKVSSSAQPANSDSRPGGSVTAATMSGTNNFHGDVFEFLRNGSMDAATEGFAQANGSLSGSVRDNLKRNQFGGTIGGPIVHNKVFLFYGFQGTTERQQTAAGNTIVPTPAVLAGDFTTFLGAACQNGRPITLHATVPSPNGGPAQPLTTAPGSNILLPQWLNTPSAQIAAKYAALLPAPTDGCGDVTLSHYNPDNEYQNVVRVDWQRTASDALFARYFVDDYNLQSYLAPGKVNLLSSNGAGLADRFQSLVLGDTHTLSPTMVNSFRLSFSRTATVRTSNPQIPTLCALGAHTTCMQPNQVQLLFNSPGFLGYDFENVFGITESLGWQRGTHYLQVGGSWQHVQMNGDGVFQVNPRPSFSTGATSYTGENMADFVTGNLDGYGQGNGQISRDAQNISSVYFQDAWRATPRITVNYGVRWQPFFPQHSGYAYNSDFTLAGYSAGTLSHIYPNAPPGMTFPGDAGFNGLSDTKNSLNQWAPTVGIAWDPTGKGSESIRAGYGVDYDTSVLWNTMHVVLNPPWGSTLSFTPLPVNASSADPLAGGGVANPFFNVPGGNPFPTSAPGASFVFPSNGTFVFEDQNAKLSRSQQWNVSLQKQFGANWLASATYIGSRTSGIWAGVNLDPSVVITAGMTAPGIVDTSKMSGTSGPCTLLYLGQAVTFPQCNSSSRTSVNGVNNENARRKLTLANPTAGPLFNGGVVQAQSIGRATYNGLLLSLRHRLSNGLSILSNYTWSHCLDNANAGQDIGNSFQDPANPAGDYGNCITDRRHAVNLSLVAQSPRFSSSWEHRVLGDWSASGIFTWSSGSPFTVSDGTDNSLTGVGADRPNVVANPFTAGPVASNPTCTAPGALGTTSNWFNPCAFVPAGVGAYGNESPNSLYGPGGWNLNAAVWRTFPVTERTQLSLRVEGFNVLNHPGISLPGSNLNSGSSLGRIIGSMNSPRIMQLALKVTF